MNNILINNAFGEDNVEKASVAFIVGGASAARDGETAIFLTSKAIFLATEGGTDGLQADGYKPVQELLQAYVNNGGIIWVCKACADAKNIDDTHMVSGAQIAGAGHILGFIDDGAQVLM